MSKRCRSECNSMYHTMPVRPQELTPGQYRSTLSSLITATPPIFPSPPTQVTPILPLPSSAISRGW